MTGNLTWDEDDAPRSTAFGDVYFSREGGLDESRAVFLQGCGLPEAWAGRDAFCIAELGFGTGLNIAAALELWRASKPAGARLHLFSIEAYPLDRADAARALAAFPELAPVTEALLARWPGRARGVHRVDLPAFDAVLDVAIMDAAEALDGWSGKADAWFLDGFAPARNPGMWSDEVLRLVAARSAPGARAATYTVAGAVRRGLEAAGFLVERRPGFGRKRERLEARAQGAAPSPPPPPRIAILGAGVAGASLARAFEALGASPTVFDGRGPGGGASGNPAGLVTPRLDAGLGDVAALFAGAFRRAIRLYEDLPEAVLARGVLQLQRTPRDAGRFEAIAASDLFEPGALTTLDTAEASARFGEPVPGALLLHDALVIEPARVLQAWLGDVVSTDVRPERSGDGPWRLMTAGGACLAEADVVVLTAGAASAELARALGGRLALQPVRGQISVAEAEPPGAAAAFGGYVIPTRTGVLFGATHDRDDRDEALREADHDRNRATLAATAPVLAARLADAPLSGRASVRAASGDHLPVAGPLEPDGLYVLSGLAARGFCLAPLLAEHLAATILGRPSPLPAAQTRLVDPGRFRERALRRGRFGRDAG